MELTPLNLLDESEFENLLDAVENKTWREKYPNLTGYELAKLMDSHFSRWEWVGDDSPGVQKWLDKNGGSEMEWIAQTRQLLLSLTEVLDKMKDRERKRAGELMEFESIRTDLEKIQKELAELKADETP
jgi:hypothetical protein